MKPLLFSILIGLAPCLDSAVAQEAPSTQTAKQRKEAEKAKKQEEKRAKQEAEQRRKALEKEAKAAAKEERRIAQINRRAHLRSSADIVSSATPERLGSALKDYMLALGYVLSEYHPPQLIFGQETPYKAVFTARLTEADFVRWKVIFHMNYGTSGDPYSVVYFEISPRSEGAFLIGRIGVAANTVKGLALEDLTSSEGWRDRLDSILKRAKENAESP